MLHAKTSATGDNQNDHFRCGYDDAAPTSVPILIARRSDPITGALPEMMKRIGST